MVVDGEELSYKVPAKDVKCSFHKNRIRIADAVSEGGKDAGWTCTFCPEVTVDWK